MEVIGGHRKSVRTYLRFQITGKVDVVPSSYVNHLCFERLAPFRNLCFRLRIVVWAQRVEKVNVNHLTLVLCLFKAIVGSCIVVSVSFFSGPHCIN